MSILSTRKPILAVQWDRSTIDYLLAERKAGRVRVLAAGTAVWNDGETPTSPGEEIQKVVQQLGVRRPETLVGVSRGQVDVLPLQLPPAEDDELPVLVTNQVVRDGGELAESGVIDYVTLDSPDDQVRHVFAFVVDAGTLEQVRAECAKASLKLESILYRPLASVALLHHMVPPSQRTMILVTLHDKEADLSIVRSGRLLYTRTARLGDASAVDEMARQLAVEVRRSLAAASLVADGEQQHLYVFGSLEETQHLVEKLADEMAMPVSLLDPLHGQSLQEATPQRVSRVAPLLGMVYERVEGTPLLDFLNPKQPPPPPNHWRRAAVYVAALLILAIMGGYYLWDLRVQAADQANKVQRSLNRVTQQLARVQQKQAIVQAVQQWQHDDINWLDELYDITRRFPDGKDAMVRRLTIGPGRGGCGVVDMSVQVRDTEVITQLDDQLRDSYHDIRSQRVSEQKSGSTYPWAFETRITLQRRSVDQYRESPESALAKDDGPARQDDTATTPVSKNKK